MPAAAPSRRSRPVLALACLRRAAAWAFVACAACMAFARARAGESFPQPFPLPPLFDDDFAPAFPAPGWPPPGIAPADGPPPGPELAEEWVVHLDGSDSSDAEGAPLAYRWRQREGPAVVLSDPAAVRPFFSTSRVGTYVFELVVSDGRLESEPALITIDIHPKNRPPVIPFAELGLEAETGQSVTLDASSAYDPDGQPLQFRWTQREGPETAALSGLSGPYGTPGAGVGGLDPIVFFTPRLPGTYVFEIGVSDGEDETTALFQVQVRLPKPAPVAKVAAVAEPVSRGQDPPAAPAPDSAGPGPVPPGVEAFSGPSYLDPPPLIPSSLFSEPPPIAPAPPPAEPPRAQLEYPPSGQVGEALRLAIQVETPAAGLEYHWQALSGPEPLPPPAQAAEYLFTPARPGVYTFEATLSDGHHRPLKAKITIEVTAGPAASQGPGHGAPPPAAGGSQA